VVLLKLNPSVVCPLNFSLQSSEHVHWNDQGFMANAIDGQYHGVNGVVLKIHVRDVLEECRQTETGQLKVSFLHRSDHGCYASTSTFCLNRLKHEARSTWGLCVDKQKGFIPVSGCMSYWQVG